MYTLHIGHASRNPLTYTSFHTLVPKIREAFITGWY